MLASAYYPRPLRGDDGELVWGGGLGTPPPPQWGPGGRIGVALRYLPEFDRYSLMGEAFFLPHKEGGIAFLPHEDPVEAGPPVGATGLEVEELMGAIAACDGSEAEAAATRHTRYWNGWGPGSTGQGSPTKYVAARCSDKGWDPCAPSEPDPENGDGDGDGDGGCEG